MAFAVRRGIRKPGRIHESFFALEVVAGIRERRRQLLRDCGRLILVSY